MENDWVDEKKALSFLKRLCGLQYNKECADCGRKTPSWATLTFGLFICYECSGKHRKLGFHISKVKNISMDRWTLGELRRMYVGGNKNKYKIKGTNDDHDQNKYIGQEKYVKELDFLVEKSEVELSGDSFMEENIDKGDPVELSEVKIKKQAIPSFGKRLRNKPHKDEISKEEESISPPDTHPQSVEESKREIIEIKEANTPLFVRKPGVNFRINKELMVKRSPLSFSIDQHKEEEDSDD